MAGASFACDGVVARSFVFCLFFADACVDYARLFAEMQLLQRVSHPNICKLLGYSQGGPQICLVLELCTGGSLAERLLRTPRLSTLQSLQTMVAMGRALVHLHNQTPPMIHRGGLACVCELKIETDHQSLRLG